MKKISRKLWYGLAGTGAAGVLGIALLPSAIAGPGKEDSQYSAAHTQILGNGTAGTVTIPLTSTGGADPFSVFGQTTAAQNPKPPSTYSSTITATVTF